MGRWAHDDIAGYHIEHWPVQRAHNLAAYQEAVVQGRSSVGHDRDVA